MLNLNLSIVESWQAKRSLLTYFAKIYLALFGYPDLGGHIYFPHVVKFLNPLSVEKILDAGCGNGIYINTFVQKFKIKGWGIDINEIYLKRAKVLAKNLNLQVKFKKMSLTNLQFADDFFDKIFSVQTLQFIKDDQKALGELSRVLKKSGILVLAFPGEKYYSNIGQKQLKKKELETMIVKRSGYSLEKMKQMLTKVGFRILEIKVITGPLFKKLSAIQNYFYLKNLRFLNLLSFPILLLLAQIDASLRKAKPAVAVYLLKAQKQ